MEFQEAQGKARKEGQEDQGGVKGLGGTLPGLLGSLVLLAFLLALPLASLELHQTSSRKAVFVLA